MLNRFHLPADLDPGATVQLSDDEMHHAARVHRTRVGDQVELFDGRGRAVLAAVRDIEKSVMHLEILSVIEETREAPVAVEMAMALIQPERFELVLQKGTEIGIRTFLPLITSRTEVRPERVRGKGERWEKVVLEATKQSGRSVIPEIERAAPIEQALARPGTNVVLDPSGDRAVPTGDSIRLFVGPEGGFSDDELESARRMSVTIWSLGPRRLRAETAAIAAAAMVLLK